MGVRQMNTPVNGENMTAGETRRRRTRRLGSASAVAGRPDRRSPQADGLGRGQLEGEHPCRARASGLRPEPGDPRREARRRGRGEEDRRRRRDHDRKHLGRQPGEGVRGRDRRQGRRDLYDTIDGKAISPAIEKANAAGIPVVCYVSCGVRGKHASKIVFDWVGIGKAEGVWLGKTLKAGGREERRDARLRPGRHEQGRPGCRRDLQGPQRRDQGGRRHPQVGRHPADELGSRQGPHVCHRRARPGTRGSTR